MAQCSAGSGTSNVRCPYDTQDFLKTVLEGCSSLGRNESKLYQNFIIKFLHTVVSKLKTIQDDALVKEIADACIVCCEAYNKLQENLEKDKACTAPKLVYHIVIGLKKQEYVPEVINLSCLMYEMVFADGWPLTSETNNLVSAIVASIWNTAGKLARQTASDMTAVPMEHVLKLWRTCFLFLCLQSDRTAMINKLRTVMSEFIPAATPEEHAQLSPVCLELISDIFVSILEKMANIPNQIENSNCKESLSLHIIEVKTLFIEHLLRHSGFSKAQEIILSVKEQSTLSSIVSCLYKVCAHVMAQDEESTVLAEVMKQANDEAFKLCQENDTNSYRILHYAYSYFTKLTSLESFYSQSNFHVFREQCILAFDLALDLSAKVMDFMSKEDMSDKKKADQYMRLYIGMLKCYYKDLQLISQELRNMESEEFTSMDLPQKSVTVASDFSSWLEKDPFSLPSKTMCVHRYNCGFVCFNLGKMCIKQGQHSNGAELYELAVLHLGHCQEPKVPKIMESLLECYLQLEKLTDATRVVLQILISAGEEWANSVTLWYRLKKDALAKGMTMFQSMTLREVVNKAGVMLPSATDRQLLQSEYQAWRKASRRNPDVEYRILCELCEDTTSSDLERAVSMVDLAANMCQTGYLYKDRPAGELLNKAIIVLDKVPDRTGASLALAFFTKYIISHEEVIKEQNCQTNVKDDEEDVVADESDNDQATSKYSATLESEQIYLPYLIRAVELWEGWFSGGAQKSSKKKGTKASKEHPEIAVDLEQHMSSLMECGTRLILMKHPLLALRALKTARGQLDNIASGRQRESLQLQMARMWVLLGQVQEAESLIPCCDTPTKKDSQPILQAELCMISGKKEEGVDILNKVLDNPDNQPTSQQSFLLDGTAKRLLSMFLCFPDIHTANSTNQYLLFLAYEAVRSHVSVLKSVVKNEGEKKFRAMTTDKWLLLHEMLQSVLHLCQLCRFVGLPHEAYFYLKEGLSMAHNSGLPRWSCEFLFELLRVHMLVGDFEAAMGTVELIYQVLDPQPTQEETTKKFSSGKTFSGSENINDTKNKTDKQPLTSISDSDCFGFQDLDVEQKAAVTPEKECVTKTFSSAHKQKLSKIPAPECLCIQRKSKCDDRIRHRLCMKAGLVIAEFLTQVDMRSTAEKLLQHTKCSVTSSIENDNSLIDMIMQQVTPEGNGNLSDPQMIYVCLEACCIEAEMYMYQNNYQRVHQIWQTLQEIQEAGHLKNVLHSNVVMTRLALCDVNAYMKSLQCLSSTDSSTSLIGSLTEDLDKLNLKEKKVSFSENDSLYVEGKKLTGAKRRLVVDSKASKNNGSEDGSLSPKGSISLDGFVTTPCMKTLSKMNNKSVKKDKLTHMLQTPVSSRIAVLDCLMDSDSDQEIDVIFPTLKPITPKVATDKKSKPGKGKTEPRNRRGKPKFEVIPDPVCKLEDVLNADDSIDEAQTGANKTRRSSGIKNSKQKNAVVHSKRNSVGDDEASDLSVDGQKIEIAEKALGRGRGKKKATETVSKTKVGRGAKRAGKDKEINDAVGNVKENTAESKQIVVQEENLSNTKALQPIKDNFKPAVKQDIYDFNPEDSPSVGVTTAKNKKTGAKPKSSKIPKSKGKENKTVEKVPVKTRRGRSKQQGDDVELQRRVYENKIESLDLSYEEIDISDVDLSIDSVIDISIDESISVQNCDKTDENALGKIIETIEAEETEYEAIEIMRSDPEPKTSKRAGRGGKRTGKKEMIPARKQSVGDESEVMRSGCPLSIKALSEKMEGLSNMDGMDEESPQVHTEISPGGDLNLSSSSMISSLEMMYEQIRHLAWYPQHPEICQVLALHYIDTDPWRAAFLLMDSIGVTFRHQAMLNVGRKVRKQGEKKELSPSSTVQQSGDNLACIKEGLLFDKDETSLKDMVSVIPSNWVVVQLSVISTASTGQQFVLTRFVNDQMPLVVRLPGFASPQGRQILSDFKHIIESSKESMKLESRAEWWGAREKLDLDLQTLMDNIDKFWIGPWKGAFAEREYSSKLVTKVVKELKKAVKKDIDPGHVEILLLSVGRVPDQQLFQCATHLLSPQCNSADVESVVSHIQKWAKPDLPDKHHSHLILILDKNIQHLPWECTGTLSCMSVSRMPCLSHLYSVLSYMQPQDTSIYNKGVNPRHTYYIINPDQDLPHVEEKFKEWFEGESGWKGVCGTKPTKEQFTEALTERDLLIYCGHGSGTRYFSKGEIEKLQGRAVSLLMGCSSGRLCTMGRLEPSGIMLSYFMAGCPCMVANLWDVTDKDLDKFTYDLLQKWLNSTDKTYLSTQVQKSRQVCKLKYLVGSAPVVYGLPVFINREIS